MEHGVWRREWAGCLLSSLAVCQSLFTGCFLLSLVHVRPICLLPVAISLVDGLGRDYREEKSLEGEGIIEKVAVAMAVIVGSRTLG